MPAPEAVEQLLYRVKHPCKHRGGVLVAAPECGCGAVYDCPKKIQCVNTTGNVVKGKHIQGCLICDSYEESELDLKTLFDRVVLINLKRRPDRLAQFYKQIENWPFKEPQVFEAIDGSKVPTPEGWKMGGGTWGCLQSHRQILERAIQDGVKNLLVLEDDLTVTDNYVEKLKQFFTDVPEDWDQLMLGGQHCSTPSRLPNKIVRCTNCQRTHAYAIRGRFLKDLYARWCSHTSQTHCDHIMGPMQAKYFVYAPEEFIFGQAHSQSDINGRVNPAKTWNPPKGDEPIYLLRGPREVVEQLREYGIHIGFDREPKTGYDRGLIAAVADPSKLPKWASDLQWECVSEGTKLAAWHPDIPLDAMKAAWSGPVEEIDASTLESALLALGSPARRSRASLGIVLLRGPREAMEQAIAYGFHPGNWRDPETGQDKGLQNWWKSGKTPVHLQKTLETLVNEAKAIKGGIATVWHPDLAAADLAPYRVFEIEAATGDEAEQKLKGMIDVSPASADT